MNTIVFKFRGDDCSIHPVEFAFVIQEFAEVSLITLSKDNDARLGISDTIIGTEIIKRGAEATRFKFVWIINWITTTQAITETSGMV